MTWLRSSIGFIFTLLLIEFLDEFIFGVREAAWPMIKSDLNLTYIQVGLVLGVPGIISSIVEPFLGILADVWKRRSLILGGGVVVIGVEKVDDQFLAELSQLPAVKEATIAPTILGPQPAEGEEPKEVADSPAFPRVKIETEDSRDALVNVFTYLSERDISVRSLEILESNLENVFLHLTGKKLRE